MKFIGAWPVNRPVSALGFHSGITKCCLPWYWCVQLDLWNRRHALWGSRWLAGTMVTGPHLSSPCIISKYLSNLTRYFWPSDMILLFVAWSSFSLSHSEPGCRLPELCCLPSCALAGGWLEAEAELQPRPSAGVPGWAEPNKWHHRNENGADRRK